ncbi:MAG: S53 family peptidase [Candidatus Eremiobacteraeota bacterium]|nr:S53 family peptidase [Candidatus Eremiobacteraeota bacterium]
MNGHNVRVLATAAGIAILAACSGGSTNPTLPAGAGQAKTARVAHAAHAQPVCPSRDLRAGEARCFAWIRTDVRPSMHFNPLVSGYSPSNLQTAYNLPSSTHGSGQVVAIVDAYDNPNAESDMGVYRSNFGLPACTTANGCFKKVNQNGGTSYPSGSTGWGVEIDLDIQMVSAICPNCHIVLVEANSATFGSLGIAEKQAYTQGAGQVSNSYGGGEFKAKGYYHAGVVITASSGDGGYGSQQPCSWATVVCVGGTTLTSVSPRVEAGWSGAGSGCSSFVTKPTWQTDTGCTTRSESDVSAVADPNTGVAEYDSYGYGGWIEVGGTSVASPIIASVFALAGNHASVKSAKGIWNAGGGPNLNDVTTGPPNGSCPSQYLYICTPGPGYDGPTGWGTPNGIGAF